MLHLFHMDVSKVYLGMLHRLHMLHLFQRHVVSICFECFRCFRCMFHLCFFERMLQVCLRGCCLCFTHTLHVFYLDVAYGCNGFQVFSGVFRVFHKHVSTAFRHILQLLYLDV